MKKNPRRSQLFLEDPNYFLRYVKKYGIGKTDICPLMNSSTNSLSIDKYEMCHLLVDTYY